MKALIVFVLIAIPFLSEGQKKSKEKVSYAKGTIYGYWGYNRTAYTKSNMRFVGPEYDFTLVGVRAADNPSTDIKQYVRASTITVPQFNARIGYYFKDHWAISLGYDHMKYLINDGNQVKMYGHVDAGVDTVTNLSGDYDGEVFTTDRTKFHYENSNGLNYLRAEVTRTDQWLTFGKNKWFGFSTNVGLSAGALLTFNDFRFAGNDDRVTISLSGYGLSVSSGLRFEFFKHVFLQANVNGGFHHLVKVKSRPDPSKQYYIKQKYGFIEGNVVLGLMFYIRSKNACDSCPVW